MTPKMLEIALAGHWPRLQWRNHIGIGAAALSWLRASVRSRDPPRRSRNQSAKRRTRDRSGRTALPHPDETGEAGGSSAIPSSLVAMTNLLRQNHQTRHAYQSRRDTTLLFPMTSGTTGGTRSRSRRSSVPIQPRISALHRAVHGRKTSEERPASKPS